jgi:hypothetical protein
MEEVPRLIQLYRVKRQHVEDDPVALNGMPTHAVTGTGDRDGEAFGTGPANQGDKLLLGKDRVGWNVPDFGNTRLVQAARVVDEPVRWSGAVPSVPKCREREMEAGPAQNSDDQPTNQHAGPDPPPSVPHGSRTAHRPVARSKAGDLADLRDRRPSWLMSPCLTKA